MFEIFEHDGMLLKRSMIMIGIFMKSFLSTTLFSVFLSLCLISPAQSETNPVKDQLARELIYETKSIENVTILMKDQLKLILGRKLMKKPNIPEGTLDKLLPIIEGVFEEHIEGLIGPMVKIYSDAFTEEELSALIVFHKSPVGRKSAKIMPTLVQKGMVIGAQWGQEVAKVAVERLKAEFKKDGFDI